MPTYIRQPWKVQRMKKSLTDKDYVATIKAEFKDVKKKYPEVMEFLEMFCGYDTPVLSTDPNQIAYAGGKRDVILTIKTIMRDDATPEAIAYFYENLERNQQWKR